MEIAKKHEKDSLQRKHKVKGVFVLKYEQWVNTTGNKVFKLYKRTF